MADFRSALRRFQRISERIARRHGLTGRRYELLVMIAGAKTRNGSATISQLAQRLYLEKHTVTELVARAEEAGLVERSPDPDDRRVSHLTLTAEGHTRLARTLDDLRPERERITKMLADLHKRARALPGA